MPFPPNSWICRGQLVQGASTTDDRIPCGCDLTEIIEAVPQDGEDHWITCPDCGNEAKITRMPAAVDGG